MGASRGDTWNCNNGVKGIIEGLGERGQVWRSAGPGRSHTHPYIHWTSLVTNYENSSQNLLSQIRQLVGSILKQLDSALSKPVWDVCFKLVRYEPVWGS